MGTIDRKSLGKDLEGEIGSYTEEEKVKRRLTAIHGQLFPLDFKDKKDIRTVQHLIF